MYQLDMKFASRIFVQYSAFAKENEKQINKWYTNNTLPIMHYK